jgi:hypothetical protein
MSTPRLYSRKRGFLVAVAIAIPAMLIGSGLYAPPAQAGFIVTLVQEGSNVVATGSGTINFTGLTLDGSISTSAFINSTDGIIFTGPTSAVPTSIYGHFTVSSSFQSGGPFVPASSGNGDFVGIGLHNAELLVPSGYVSGNPLSDNSTFDNQTFSSLGVIPGTYVYKWGSGANADSFTVQIGAVPAPLIGRGLPVLLAVGGMLFGAKLLERGKRHKLQSG